MDIIHIITNWLDHNRYTAIASLLAVIITLPACVQMRGTSPVTGKEESALVLEKEEAQVKAELKARVDKAEKAKATSAAQLRAEFEQRAAAINAAHEEEIIDIGLETEKYAAGFQVAQEQIEAQASKWEWALDASNTVVGIVAPQLAPVWATATTLIAGGLFGDNRRKNQKLKEAKAAAAALPATT
jgi:hypothetical protein